MNGQRAEAEPGPAGRAGGARHTPETKLRVAIDQMKADIVARYEHDVLAAKRRAEEDLRLYYATRRQLLSLLAAAVASATGLSGRRGTEKRAG